MNVAALLWVRIVTDLAVLCVLAVFVWKAYRTKWRTESLIDEIAEERRLVAGLLTTVKGWVVVHVEEAEHDRRDRGVVKQAADELRSAVAKVPDETASKVVERLTDPESGTTLPAVKMPPPPPPFRTDPD